MERSANGHQSRTFFKQKRLPVGSLDSADRPLVVTLWYLPLHWPTKAIFRSWLLGRDSRRLIVKPWRKVSKKPAQSNWRHYSWLMSVCQTRQSMHSLVSSTRKHLIGSYWVTERRPYISLQWVYARIRPQELRIMQWANWLNLCRQARVKAWSIYTWHTLKFTQTPMQRRLVSYSAEKLSC